MTSCHVDCATVLLLPVRDSTSAIEELTPADLFPDARRRQAGHCGTTLLLSS